LIDERPEAQTPGVKVTTVLEDISHGGAKDAGALAESCGFFVPSQRFPPVFISKEATLA
jgi:hypothetical protein